MAEQKEIILKVTGTELNALIGAIAMQEASHDRAAKQFRDKGQVGVSDEIIKIKQQCTALRLRLLGQM